MAKKPVLYGIISSGYGKRILKGKEQFHTGIDIIAHDLKPIVCAAYSGVVSEAGWSDTFGNRVWIKNDVGYYAVYAHLDSINPNLTEGKKVVEGDFIGIMGNTGLSYGRHLHFELRKSPVAGAQSIEPIEIINLYKP